MVKEGFEMEKVTVPAIVMEDQVGGTQGAALAVGTVTLDLAKKINFTGVGKSFLKGW